MFENEFGMKEGRATPPKPKNAREEIAAAAHEMENQRAGKAVPFEAEPKRLNKSQPVMLRKTERKRNDAEQV